MKKEIAICDKRKPHQINNITLISHKYVINFSKVTFSENRINFIIYSLKLSHNQFQCKDLKNSKWSEKTIFNTLSNVNLKNLTSKKHISLISTFIVFSSTTFKLESFHSAITFQENNFLRSNKNSETYLTFDLKTSRLNDIHQHFWLADFLNAARPLHRQKLIERIILVIENSNEHFVWFEAQIFIKSLPDFLLDHDYWSDNLCSDLTLYESACDFLLSYAWLIRHQSDLDIAKKSDLMLKNIEWHNWAKFLKAFLNNINLETLKDVNKRYLYEKLRLSRLNIIYRFMPLVYFLRNFVRNYQSESIWRNAFFERHFKWMLVVFVILSIFLSTLQIGLITTMLQSHESFHRVSYEFVIASLIMLVINVMLIFLIWFALFWYYLIFTWRNDRAVIFKKCSCTDVIFS